MNLIEELLQADLGKINQREGKIISRRLTELLGKTTHVTLRAISPERFDQIQKDCILTDKQGHLKEFSISRLKTFVVLEGLVDPDLKNKDLQEYYKVVTPKELLFKLFDAGEIQRMQDEINELSGFGDVEEEDIIKNL